MLPAGRWRARRRCGCRRRARRDVSGLVQVVQLPPSMRHSKVEPLSEELKVKLGVVLLDGSAGLESIVRVRGGQVDVQV